MNTFKKTLILLVTIQTSWLLCLQQPITLFCHGIVDNQSQANRYKEFLETPYQTFNFPDAEQPQAWDLNSLIFNSCSLFGKQVNRDKMFMGHGLDIATLKNQINPNDSYILYGLSRGGATAISYLAQHNPTNIKALILDATPGDVVATINDVQYAIGYKFAPERSTQEALFHTLFPAYPINSTPALQDITKIHNKNIPIFIIHSHDDTRVHISSAWQLYVAFLEAGFTHVYLCQLTTGVHGYYMQGADNNVYLQALHSFYKHYNFAYNEQFSGLDLKTLQPTVQEISEKLLVHQKKSEDQYQQKQAQINGAITTISIIIAARLALYQFNQSPFKKNIQENL